jgi:hypothetical protein
LNRSINSQPSAQTQTAPTPLDVVGQSRRESRRGRKLPPSAACAVCGVTAPRGLAPSSVLEFNHIPGDAIDPDLGACFCLTHHALWTAGQVDRRVDLRHGTRRTWLEVVSTFLEEIGEFFLALGQRMLEQASGLKTTIDTLDAIAPEWRDNPALYPT